MPRKSNPTNRMTALALAFAAFAVSVFFFQSQDEGLAFAETEIPAASSGARP